MFYNTTGETGAELRQHRQRAANQDNKVLSLFANHGGLWTPSEVHRAALPLAPLTSVRRSITNLTKAGRLIRTDTKRRGPYGRLEYAWRLAGEPVQQELLS